MAARKPITVYCRICKKPIETLARNKKYCTDCKKKVHNAKSKSYSEENYKAAKKKKPVPRLAEKSIGQVMAELAQYNQKNKCSLTYGQYMAMMEAQE